ncbi:hypothetical protein [Ruminococcus sp.]|uniref:hypothetical protein n=1 Tax=Ruminococcus sp. TaxID=41978 RepID=UPI0038687C8E
MLLFILLKLTKMLTISWWWIPVALIASIVPMGLTICFVLLKLLGGFATDVSWWWIVGTIVLDLIENVILKNWMDGKYS